MDADGTGKVNETEKSDTSSTRDESISARYKLVLGFVVVRIGFAEGVWQLGGCCRAIVEQ